MIQDRSSARITVIEKAGRQLIYGPAFLRRQAYKLSLFSIRKTLTTITKKQAKRFTAKLPSTKKKENR